MAPADYRAYLDAPAAVEQKYAERTNSAILRVARTGSSPPTGRCATT